MHFSLLSAVFASLPLFAHAAVWNITVGGSAGLVYTPPSVNATTGDILHFIFEATNHTVTQSTFETPCSPLLGGVNTGFNFPVNSSVTSDFPTFDIIVTDDTQPMWFYCAQPDHCSQGMVFAANPPATGDQTFDAFKTLATETATNTTSGSVATTAPATSSETSTAFASAKWSKRGLLFRRV